MNENVYVEVFLPALNTAYDFILPIKMKTGAVIDLMAVAIMEKEHIALNPEYLLLFDFDRKLLIDCNLTVYGAKIMDGNRLMLV